MRSTNMRTFKLSGFLNELCFQKLYTIYIFSLFSFCSHRISAQYYLAKKRSSECLQDASVSPFKSRDLYMVERSKDVLNLLILTSALDDPDNVWSYCPSVPAAFILFVLFGLSALLHIYQAIKYRKGFAWVIIMGATWETLSFATRILSAHSPTKKGIYDGSFLLLIISPLLINAFDYMLLGRMVTFFLPDNKLGGIKGSIMGVIFVGCDTM